MAPKFLPLAEPWLDELCADAVRAQVLSSFIGPGATCREFSEALERFNGARHCVLTTSGTAALSVGAVSLGLRPGDEILVPAYGVISTINAFSTVGLRPRLVDIDRSTGCMAAEALSRRVTRRTRAICFVDFSGHMGEALVRVAEAAAQLGLPLIEDAAAAFGHRWKARSAGTLGTIGALSFSTPKVLTTGQGGAVLTDSDSLADRAREYIDHGDLHWRETNLNHDIGTNLRFNDVLAALGLAQTRTIEQRLARKASAYAALHAALGEKLFAVPGDQAPLHYIVFTPRPGELVSILRERGIGAVRQYRSIYQHPAYASLRDSEFTNSDYWTDHAVYLPFGLALSVEDARRIAREVEEADVELFDAPT